MNIESYRSIPVMTDGRGYVYVIKNEHGIKIGKTTNVYQRLTSLSNSNSGGCEILDVFVSDPCFVYSTLESVSHLHFNKIRTVGEWFKADFDDAVSFIKSTMASEAFSIAETVRSNYVKSKR